MKRQSIDDATPEEWTASARSVMGTMATQLGVPSEWSHPTAPSNTRQEGGGHYKQFRFETWDVIADWGLGYFDGNAVKYLSRWRHKHLTKSAQIEDLRKAKHYIEKLIEMETRDGK